LQSIAARTTGGTWHTSPLCAFLDGTGPTAKKPKAGGGRDLQQGRKGQGKVALLAQLVEGIFVIELPIFNEYFAISPLNYELSCCLLLLVFTTT